MTSSLLSSCGRSSARAASMKRCDSLASLSSAGAAACSSTGAVGAATAAGGGGGDRRGGRVRGGRRGRAGRRRRRGRARRRRRHRGRRRRRALPRRSADAALDLGPHLRPQVLGDLAGEVGLAGEEEGAVGLDEAPAAGVGEAEVVDGAVLAGIEVAALLERADGEVGLAELQVHQAEVELVRGIGGRGQDQALVDRARAIELAAAEVGEAEERQRLGALGRDRQRGLELLLGLRQPALAQELAARDDVLLEAIGGAEGAGGGHGHIITLPSPPCRSLLPPRAAAGAGAGSCVDTTRAPARSIVTVTAPT